MKSRPLAAAHQYVQDLDVAIQQLEEELAATQNALSKAECRVAELQQEKKLLLPGQLVEPEKDAATEPTPEHHNAEIVETMKVWEDFSSVSMSLYGDDNSSSLLMSVSISTTTPSASSALESSITRWVKHKGETIEDDSSPTVLFRLLDASPPWFCLW